MNCPFCNSPNYIVKDSRMNKAGDIRRRRLQCSDCNKRWSTVEVLDSLYKNLVHIRYNYKILESNLLVAGDEKKCSGCYFEDSSLNKYPCSRCMRKFRRDYYSER